MISNSLATSILIVCAALLAAAAAAPFVIPPLTRAWRKTTTPGRSVFFIAALCAMLYAGTKPTNQVDGVGLGLRSRSTMEGNVLCSTSTSDFDFPLSPVTDEDLARGWQRLGPFTNATISYTMPAGAAFATNWWLRGAFEDVTPVSNLWAFAWGKVRFALADTNEIVAVGAPMSAIPLRSRLWSAAGTNGAWFVTWENFVLGREAVATNQLQSTIHNPQSLISAQVEFHPNGDYVTRSNEVETVWRRIDPDDYDGDGYLNDDDPVPYDWTDGADDYYGPANELPWGCNEDAYCDVTVRIDGSRGEWVTFTGDGESDYPDPLFYAKPGVPYDVKILIGKTYRVTCDAPIRAIGKSDPDIEVLNADTNAFTVVWPVTITEAPCLFAAPMPGLLGGSHGNTGFQMAVVPSWLDGVFRWTTNTCCHIVDNGGWYAFACEDGCTCGGCQVGGNYVYEGYAVFFSGISCGCRYTPHAETRWGISAPSAVFKDGALRPLEITFDHGDPGDPEEGELALEIIRGSDKIRIWNDPEKTGEASAFNWAASSFGGITYYVEGIETSSSIGDIEFKLTWSRPGGTSVNRTGTTTCAEVKETQVDSPTAGITDGSPNPQPFDGHTNWTFDVTRSLDPDKHFAVLFRDAVNTNDFSVRDFSVRMTLVVQPTGAPVGTASWFPLDPTPQSGAIVSTGAHIGELRNPKVGGVYHIGSCFDGSPTNECSIVLPLAGAEMYGILAADLGWADRFAVTGREQLPKRWIERVKFGCKWFNWLENGFYRGRPDNHQHPTIWHYNQIRDFDGLGAVGTLGGHPIRVEKLSNFIAGYTCVKIGVPWNERVLAQAIGTANDLAATLSWQAGENVANGIDFETSISSFLANAHLDSDEKTSKLWPNTAPVDNHRGYPGHGDFDREFSSPGFIYAQP